MDTQTAPAGVAPKAAQFAGDNRGNVAGEQRIDQQHFHYYIRVGDGFQPIAQAPLERLQAVRRNLRLLGNKHEHFALAPVMLAGGVMVLVAAGVPLLLQLWTGQPPSRADALAAAVLGLVAALPVWFGLHDIRRRHRRVVEQAEQRWAAIVVEIGERGDDVPYESIWQAFRRSQREMRAARRLRNR